jgi:uncharacterized protein
MISSVVQFNWQARVLEQGTMGMRSEEEWRHAAYQQYKEKLSAPEYPCFFGQTAEAREEMLYTFVRQGEVEDFLINVRRFVSLLGNTGYERSSLSAFFEPDIFLEQHTEFVARFWKTLQYLHDHDSRVAIRSVEDPLWEFCFGGCEMFVVGCSPTYQVRRSRNLGPGMVLIFQPRHLFIDPATSEPIAPAVRHRIHRRMQAYDGIPVHPDIGFYGDTANREWKQYALPDDNAPELGICPFHSKG